MTLIELLTYKPTPEMWLFFIDMQLQECKTSSHVMIGGIKPKCTKNGPQKCRSGSAFPDLYT